MPKVIGICASRAGAEGSGAAEGGGAGGWLGDPNLIGAGLRFNASAREIGLNSVTIFTTGAVSSILTFSRSFSSGKRWRDPAIFSFSRKDAAAVGLEDFGSVCSPDAPVGAEEDPCIRKSPPPRRPS